jgi:hypothetical protein
MPVHAPQSAIVAAADAIYWQYDPTDDVKPADPNGTRTQKAAGSFMLHFQ